ncbi:MAG: hypothetical protein V4660_09500 [Pseudomonadota bacterium]
MWVIGFIILVAIYVSIAKVVYRLAREGLKAYVMALSLLIPFLLPFSYHLKPSYYEFKSLCSDSSRYEVTKIHVDYVPPFSGCKMGFDVMNSKNYKGFECTSYPADPNEYPREYRLHQFTKNEKWNTEECQYGCFKGQKYSWEKSCLDICFNRTPISKPSSGLEFKSDHTDVIKNRIRKHESYVINEKSEIIARSVNYFYYMYGNGLAKMLGGSSGDAPTLSCAIEYTISKLDFLPVKENIKSN